MVEIAEVDEMASMDKVQRVLEQARAFGFLGPGPVERHIHHARGFARAIALSGASLNDDAFVVDLGSGGGVPGLVLAVEFPATRWVLVDASQRRTDFLRRSVVDLAIGDRVAVRTERAEKTGRSELRESVDVVVARGFAGPAPTAECAAPLLCSAGRLVVSEPPLELSVATDRPDRWPTEGLDRAGLAPFWRSSPNDEFQFFVAVRTAMSIPTLPRREGLPEKRPLF